MNWYLAEYYTPGGMDILFAWVYAIDMATARLRIIMEAPRFHEIIQISHMPGVEALSGTSAIILGR